MPRIPLALAALLLAALLFVPAASPAATAAPPPPAPLAAAAPPPAATASVVIGEVFAGGGNSGAPYANDYVELFNRSSSTVNLAGWTLQYASSGSTSWDATPLTGTL